MHGQTHIKFVPGQVNYVRTEVMSKIQCEYFVKTHNKICIYLTIFIYTLKYWTLSNIFPQAMQLAVHLRETIHSCHSSICCTHFMKTNVTQQKYNLFRIWLNKIYIVNPELLYLSTSVCTAQENTQIYRERDSTHSNQQVRNILLNIKQRQLLSSAVYSVF